MIPSSPTSTPEQEIGSSLDPMDPTTLIQLLRQMSHDMRGPLGVLTSTGGLWLEGVYGELNLKQNRAVVRMQRSSDRLLSLLDCFITYVKANSGQYPLTTAAFDPQDLLQTLVAKAKPYADEKHIALCLI